MIIVLKLEVKLVKIIIKDIINWILYIKIKSGVFNTKYKELIYTKKYKINIIYSLSYF